MRPLPAVLAAVVLAAPPVLAQDSLRLLEEEAAALQRRSDAFRDRVDATIRGEHRRRQRRIDDTFEAQIRAEEAAQRAARRRAIRELERFLARYPNEPRHAPDALFRLAELRYEESYAAWLEASDRWEAAGDESAPPPDKDYGPTIALFRRLIERWPGYRHLDGAFYLLGYCLSEMGRAEEAKESWLALVCATRTAAPRVSHYDGCEPIAPDSAFLAEVWFRLGEHDFDDSAPDALEAAIDAYRRVLAWRDGPFVDEALYKLAWAHYRAEQYPEAIRHFTELLELAETRGSELREEAVQYAALSFAEDDWDGDGRPDRASSLERVQDVRLMPQDRPWTGDVVLQLAEVTLDLARYPEAIRLFHLFLQRFPMHVGAPRALERIAVVHDRAGEPSMAAAARRRLAVYGANGAWARANAAHPEVVRRGAALAADAAVAEAVEHHQRAQTLRQRAVVEEDPGLLRQALREYGLAVAAYRALLERAPDDPIAYELRENLADALFWSEQWSAAAEQYAMVRDSNFDDRFLSDAALGAVVALERHLAAEEAAGRVTIRRAPPSPVRPEELPEPLARLVAAREAYVRRVGDARDREGRGPAFAYENAMALFHHGRWDEARAIFRSLFDRRCHTHETGLFAWQRLVQIAEALGQTAEAERLAILQTERRCAAPGPGPTCGDRTCAAGEACRNGACIPAGRLGVEVAHAARLQRAMQAFAAAERGGSYDAAAQVLLQAVDAAPRHPDAAAALVNAAVALDRADRVASATAVRERIVREYPNAPGLDDVLFRAGLGHAWLFEIDEAILAYERLTNDSRFAGSRHRVDALAHAAVLLRAQGQDERAARAFAAFARIAPDGEEALQAGVLAAELTAQRGATRDAERMLDELLRRFDGARGLAFSHLLRGHVLHAETLRTLGRAREAHAALQRVGEAFRASGAAPGSMAAEPAAHARFALAEREAEGFDRMRIGGVSRALHSSIRAKLERARALEDEYRQVEAFRRPAWTVAARVRIGALYDRTARALLDAPVPAQVTRLGPEAVGIYRAQLEELVRPLEERAVAEYEVAVAVAREVALESRFATEALERLTALRPESWSPHRAGRSALQLDARPTPPALE